MTGLYWDYAVYKAVHFASTQGFIKKNTFGLDDVSIDMMSASNCFQKYIFGKETKSC
jgi:hypothetical protein